MRKMLYALGILGAVFFSSCNNYSANKVSKGINTISRCCNGLLEKHIPNKPELPDGKDKSVVTGIINNAYPLFPEYTWDTKMMIW